VLRIEPLTGPVIRPFLEQYYGGRVPVDDMEGKDLVIVRCTACGLIWQRWILDDAGLELLYERWISVDESRTKKAATAGGYGPQVRRLAGLFPGRLPETIRTLDFGMGWGYWLMAARDYGVQVTGVELSATRRRFAEEQGIDAVPSTDDLGERQFDLINAEAVFEHLPDPVASLRTLVPRLASKGILRISVPDGRSIPREVARPTWAPSKDAVHPLEHINTFTHETLRRFGRDAGLMIVPQPIVAHGVRARGRETAASVYRRFRGTVLLFERP
jgi:2-polyprenyl-3-methyl-5-hydroxy-6-metoxy-1,4-benzoquinol methylase